MKTGTILWLIIGSIIVIILIYTFSGGESEEQYQNRVLKEREDKERFLRTSKDSPFKIDTIPYHGLKYFEADPAYKLTAKFTPAGDGIIFLPTSDGKELRYKRYGYADFKLYGQNNRLLILELADGSKEAGHLFIPFGDATSADETYGAGRYLDITHSPDDAIVDLDFNLAYNPYCAYSETFSCPLPPQENLLDTPIRAGEKTYE